MAGGSKTTNTTTLDPVTIARREEERQAAEAIANRPFQAFNPNQRVAGANPLLTAGLSALSGVATAGQPAVNAGIGLATQAGAFSPTVIDPTLAPGVAQVSPEAIQAALAQSGGGGPVTARDVSAISGADNLDRFLNPFTDQVVNSALSDVERQRALALANTGAAAASSGAFGSSRQGVVEALTNAESARLAGDLSGRLRSDAFNTAAGLSTQDANRFLQAQIANQGADIATGTANQNAGLSRFNTITGLDAFNAGQSNQVNTFNAGQANQVAAQNQAAGLQGNAQQLAAGQTLGSLGQTQQNLALTGADAQVRGGQVTQGIEQAQRDAAFQEFLRREQDPFLKLQALQSTSSPLGETTTTKKSGSLLGTIAGLGSVALGIPGVSGAIGGLLGLPRPAGS